MGAIVELLSMEKRSIQWNLFGFERVEETIPVKHSVATRGRVATHGTRWRGNSGARRVKRQVKGRVKRRVKGQVEEQIEEKKRVKKRVEGQQIGTEGEQGTSLARRQASNVGRRGNERGQSAGIGSLGSAKAGIQQSKSAGIVE